MLEIQTQLVRVCILCMPVYSKGLVLHKYLSFQHLSADSHNNSLLRGRQPALPLFGHDRVGVAHSGGRYSISWLQREQIIEPPTGLHYSCLATSGLLFFNWHSIFIQC